MATSNRNRFIPILCAVLALSPISTNAYYVDTGTPKSYSRGDKVDIFVNALTPRWSRRSDSNSSTDNIRSYDHYDPRFHFCKPPSELEMQRDSFGSVLGGNRIFNSAFEANFGVPKPCSFLCPAVDIPPSDATFINNRIRQGYSLNWIVDGLPNGELSAPIPEKPLGSNQTRGTEGTNDTSLWFYDLGLPLGVADEEGKLKLNNHFVFVIHYTKTSEEGKYHIVGVPVWGMSAGWDQDTTERCIRPSRTPPLHLDETKEQKVTWKYEVSWRETNTTWGNRYHKYLPQTRDTDLIHIFTDVGNAFILFVALCVLFSKHRRALKEISSQAHSRSLPTEDIHAEDDEEDHEDDVPLMHRRRQLRVLAAKGTFPIHILRDDLVFQPPRYPKLLSVVVGNGVQCLSIVLVTLGLYIAGYLSPANRGALLSFLVYSWVGFSGVRGWVSVKIFSALHNGEGTKANARIVAWYSSVVSPIAISVWLVALNLTLGISGTSGVLPFGTLFYTLFIIGLSIPGSFCGSFVALRNLKAPRDSDLSISVPLNPRHEPQLPVYLKSWIATLMAGILPFTAGVVDFRYCRVNWMNSTSFYYPGYLAITFLLVMGLSLSMALLFLHAYLRAGEYRWQQPAFLTASGSTLYLFLYIILDWSSLSEVGVASTVVLGMLALGLCAVNVLVTGTVGFLASYYAVRRLSNRHLL